MSAYGQGQLSKNKEDVLICDF